MEFFKQLEVWFVVGSQHLYGPKTLQQVADNEVVADLSLHAELPAARTAVFTGAERAEEAFEFRQTVAQGVVVVVQMSCRLSHVHVVLDECLQRLEHLGSFGFAHAEDGAEFLVGERAQLIARNEQARSRVEAMIARLKSLEQHT